MSNVEHAFENLLYEYIRGSDKWFQEWQRKEYRLNFLEMSESEIGAVMTCGLYVIDNVFNWNKEKLKEFLEGEN